MQITVLTKIVLLKCDRCDSELNCKLSDIFWISFSFWNARNNELNAICVVAHRLNTNSFNQTIWARLLAMSFGSPLLAVDVLWLCVCVWAPWVGHVYFYSWRESERAHDHTAKRAKQKTHEFRFVWIYSCNVVDISFLTLFGVRSCNVVFTFSTFQYTFTGPPKRERAIDKHSRIRCSKEKCVQTSAWFVPSVCFAVSFQWNNRLEVCSPSHDQQQQEQQQPNNNKHRRTSIRTTNVLFRLMHDNQVD